MDTFNIFYFRYNITEERIPEINDDGIKIFSVNIVQSSSNINLSYIRKHSGDKHTSHFIILIEHAVSPDAWLNDLFQEFWNLKLLNVLVLFWNDDLNIFTYSPFSSEFRIRLLSKEINYSDVFWDKTTNLMGHTLKVSIFPQAPKAIIGSGNEFSGTDGHLCMIMVNKMNATMEWLPPSDGFDYGELLKNGTSTGALGQILYPSVDVLFNRRLVRLSQYQGKSFHFTITNGRDDICILVAKAGFASNINSIFRTFTVTVWIFTFGSLLFTSLAFFGIYRFETKTPTLKDILFHFYSWNLLQTIVRLPERWSGKLLIGFWIIYCLVITSSYQGNLISSLVVRRNLPEIDTVRQLEKSSYSILTLTRYVDLLQNFLNQTGMYEKLKTRIRGMPASELFQYINNNDVAYAYANKYHINQYVMKSRNHTYQGIPVYNHMTECPVPFLIAYALYYGSPYLHRINTILRRIQESGFILYWDKQGEQTDGSAQHSGGPFALTISHVQTSFYILSAGLSISTIAFITELSIARVRMYRTSKTKHSKTQLW